MGLPWALRTPAIATQRVTLQETVLAPDMSQVKGVGVGAHVRDATCVTMATPWA